MTRNHGLTVCDTDKAFALLREEWNDLLTRSASDSVFLTWEWLHAWWRHFAGTDRLRIYCVREPGGRLVGLAPFCITVTDSAPSLRVMTFLGTVRVSSEYLDVIAERGLEETVLTAVGAGILDERDQWDMVVLPDVLESATVLRLAERFANTADLVIDRSPAQVCPYLVLPETIDAFRGQLGRRTRESLRRRSRQLRAFGGEVVLVRTAGELNEALSALFDLHRKRWISRGLPGNFEEERVRLFHHDVAPWFLENGWLRLHAVRVGGNFVACLYGFAHAGRYFYYQAGFDPAWSHTSPGAVLMQYAIEDAIAEGLCEFDFLRGDEDYKARWTKVHRRTWAVRIVSRERRWAVARLRATKAFDATKRFARRYVWAPERSPQGKHPDPGPARPAIARAPQDQTARLARRSEPLHRKTTAVADTRIRRVVVFTENPVYSVRKGIVEICEAFPDIEWLIVERARSRSVRELLRNQRNNVRKHGWRWIPHLAREGLAALDRSRGDDRENRSNGPGRQYDWNAILRRRNVGSVLVEDIHAPSVLDAVRSFAPDLGISLAAPILKPVLYSIPQEGTINLHKGKLPDFRGMPPAFWEFFADEQEFGCSVHGVEEKLDRGPIVLRTTLPRPEFGTVVGMQLMLDEVGVAMMSEAVRAFREGRAQRKPQAPGGKTFRKPTLEQEGELARRLARRPEGPAMRRFAKEAFFWWYVRVFRRVPRRILGMLGRQQVVVLLYHRVNDDLRDNLTVGIEQFNRQMECISRNYPVVDVTRLLSGSHPRNSNRPLVAVTFDDGYLDNYQIAVPILLRHKVPASFFVSTGMTGTDRPFDHDLRRLGRGLPAMTWDNLRRMRDLGFTIGSHTVTHIDCGAADDDTVRAELIESRDAIRRELGIRDMLFAYPFGRRHNIRPTTREMIRELGYTGCLSAYGGCVEGPIDAYDVRRMAIDQTFSDMAFAAVLEGFGGFR